MILFLLIRKIKSLKKQLKAREALEEHGQFELQYYELVKGHRQEIATMRHEIANQLQVVTSLLKSNDIEDKRKGAALLFDIQEQNSVSTEVNYCGNSIINTVIAVKAKFAKAFQIKTKFEISADENIGISKLDLCSIFGNLLDNAIDAAKRAEQKYIELKAGELSGFFVIKVKNSKTNEIKTVNNEIITTKSDKGDRHGKGLKLLGRLADKYNGKVNFDHDEDTFTAIMTLKL